MGMTHVAWVRDFSRTHGGARLVLYALSSRADDKTNKAFPSVTTLAKDAGLHRTNVFLAVAELEEMQEITCERRKGRSTIYTLTMGEPVVQHYQSQNTTSSAALPVAEHYPSQNTTKGVAEHYQTSSEALPIKSFKDYKGEKIDISSDVDLVADETAQETQADPASDAAYKAQSETWVDPNPITAVALWNMIKAESKISLTSGVDLHIQRTQAIAFDGDVLRVTVPSEYAFAMLTSTRMQAAMDRYAVSMGRRPLTVRFEMEEEYQTLDVLLGVNR